MTMMVLIVHQKNCIIKKINETENFIYLFNISTTNLNLKY